jgi:hypothetical protein
MLDQKELELVGGKIADYSKMWWHEHIPTSFEKEQFLNKPSFNKCFQFLWK